MLTRRVIPKLIFRFFFQFNDYPIDKRVLSDYIKRRYEALILLPKQREAMNYRNRMGNDFKISYKDLKKKIQKLLPGIRYVFMVGQIMIYITLTSLSSGCHLLDSCVYF